jgi:hypothetical protein
MLRKTKGSVSLRPSKTDYTKLKRLREPQADTTCVTPVTNSTSLEMIYGFSRKDELPTVLGQR